MRAAIFANVGDSDPGFVGRYLAEHGFEFLEYSREYPRGWKPAADIDLVVLLGSDWSVYWREIEYEVSAESDFVHTAVRKGIPVLGICFGAQLVSHAFGGKVSRAPQPELGWHSVESSTYPDLFAQTWFQWHYDMFTVPNHFKLVAGNQSCTQAILGNRVLAMQFHPEATIEIITRWCNGPGGTELLRHGIDARRLVESSDTYLPDAALATKKLVNWFLDAANSVEVVGG
jgi:GMP synthase-like glutamine amidotransferase